MADEVNVPDATLVPGQLLALTRHLLDCKYYLAAHMSKHDSAVHGSTSIVSKPQVKHATTTHSWTAANQSHSEEPRIVSLAVAPRDATISPRAMPTLNTVLFKAIESDHALLSPRVEPKAPTTALSSPQPIVLPSDAIIPLRGPQCHDLPSQRFVLGTCAKTFSKCKMEIARVALSERSLSTRWHAIREACLEFDACIARIRAEYGWCDEDDEIEAAKREFEVAKRAPFPVLHAWRLLRGVRKWLELEPKASTATLQKRQRGDTATTDGSDQANEPDVDGQPPQAKKAKTYETSENYASPGSSGAGESYDFEG
ncbi:Aste57867_14589 [Aphanomyces stellatus]|uniref:Aste57867_14589 protein n=1 Tax=Aphanomyces stellatus TaxID=120398 RepID=A0A485L1V9_9STRA|nr:hypothetical protein As57867_014535 [Aphanomyces stellatus]VFT91408.1 Aste57867_14589 [Aphanomyces stellatus]